MKLRKTIIAALAIIITYTAVFTPLCSILGAPDADIKAFAASEEDSVKIKFDDIIKQYPSGSKWYGSFAGAYQCYGFAKMVFFGLFGGLSDGTERSWRYNGTPTRGTVLIGSVSDLSESSVKSLLSKAKCGDILQLDEPRQHSMIVYSVESDGAWIYDCNGDGAYTVMLRKYDFGSFANRVSYNLSLIRSDNYSSSQEQPSENVDGSTSGGSDSDVDSNVDTDVDTAPKSPVKTPDRFTASASDITTDNATINITAKKNAEESAVKFKITLYPETDPNNKKSYEFNTAFPNGNPNNTSNVFSLQLKNECGFTLLKSTKYCYYLTSTYKINNSTVSYLSAVYSFETPETTQHTHYLTEWITAMPPTCTQGGTEHRSCICGYYELRDTDPLGHSYKETVIAPTASEQGYTLFTCTFCGDSYKDNYTDILIPETTAATTAASTTAASTTAVTSAATSTTAAAANTTSQSTFASSQNAASSDGTEASFTDIKEESDITIVIITAFAGVLIAGGIGAVIYIKKKKQK